MKKIENHVTILSVMKETLISLTKEEVADFMKQSRGLSLSDAGADDDDAELGEAWGGTQFSITSGECSAVVFGSFSPESQNILPSRR